MSSIPTAPNQTFVFNDFVFDAKHVRLTRSGVPLKVDGQLLLLLQYFLRNPGRIVTKSELIAEVWQGRALAHNILSVSVAKLRKALDGVGGRKLIVNVYGLGYRFVRPVQVREVAADGEPARNQPSAQQLGWFGPCVGRDSALLRLGDALDGARFGRGRICALLGEPGMGKTRLAEILERRALDGGFRVTWGRGHAFGDAPPLWPWLQVLRSCKSEKARALLERATHSAGVAHTSEGFAASSASSSSQTTLDWAFELASGTDSTEPWLHILEDVQWADAASLHLLSYLAADISHLPALIILTARGTESRKASGARRALDYVLGHGNCERIELTRLGLRDVENYTRGLFGMIDDELPAAVLDKSGGNPFFMVELLRPWTGARPKHASELSVTGPALDIVRQNLHHLTAEALEVLAAAAVIGRRFDLGVLASVTERASDLVLELLEDAIAARVILPLHRSCLQLTFGHDLIRSVLYEDLGRSARMRLHQRVADVYMSRAETGHHVTAAELAHHLLSALPAGDVLQAVRWSERAARAALFVGAYSDASAFLRRALDALKRQPVREPATTCNVLLGLAQCERGAGEKFAAHLEEAVAIAVRHISQMYCAKPAR